MLSSAWQQRNDDFFSSQARWNHAHLIEIAAVALQQDRQSALVWMRDQLRLLDGEGPGYHETLTQCWLDLIELCLEARLSASELARRLSFRQLPLAYYSPARLALPEATTTYLAPDLSPLALPRVLPDSLLQPLLRFQARTLSKEEWTHECHLRVAAATYLLLGEPGMHVMSAGIQRLNEIHEVPLTPTGGYHETLTRVWFALVRQAAEVTGLCAEPERADFLEATLMHLQDKKLPLKHYSRDRIMSWEARIGWLEPDLLALD